MKGKTHKQVNGYLIDLNAPLGSGGFASVYKAQKKDTKEMVAVKCISRKTVSDKYHINALKNEIRILYRLKSDHIVAFKEACMTSNTFYLIQELCDGDLAQYLKDHGGRLSEDEAVQIMTQVLTGFHELILTGIAHRDLKPQNIFYKGSTFKIADFGLSKEFCKDGLLHSAVGTQLYQSPQQILGQNYNYKCDIFAFGLIFYEMLYGILLTKEYNYRKWSNAIKQNCFPIHFPEAVPVRDSTKKLIEKCLQIKEDERADWDDVFESQLFKEKTPSLALHKKQLNYIIKQIKNQLNISQMDLESYFDKFRKVEHPKNFKIREFADFVTQLAPLTSADIKYIFRYFDENGDGELELAEIERGLKKHIEESETESREGKSEEPELLEFQQKESQIYRKGGEIPKPETPAAQTKKQEQL